MGAAADAALGGIGKFFSNPKHLRTLGRTGYVAGGLLAGSAALGAFDEDQSWLGVGAKAGMAYGAFIGGRRALRWGKVLGRPDVLKAAQGMMSPGLGRGAIEGLISESPFGRRKAASAAIKSAGKMSISTPGMGGHRAMRRAVSSMMDIKHGALPGMGRFAEETSVGRAISRSRSPFSGSFGRSTMLPYDYAQGRLF